MGYFEPEPPEPELEPNLPSPYGPKAKAYYYNSILSVFLVHGLRPGDGI